MENLSKVITEALQLTEVEVKDICRIGGMTNLNYQFTIGSKNYVVRLPGNGTEHFINRKEEKENLLFSSSLGLNPELIHFNVETGLKITEKIEDAKILTKELATKEETMKKVVGIFHILHNSNVRMKNHFELFKLMDKYEKLALEENAIFFSGFENVKKDITALRERYETMEVEACPCHIDPACGNFIIDGTDKVYLIDWEYSGMFDPLWDLAGHSMESGFTASEENLFLSTYFQRSVNELEVEKVLMHKVFQDYLWSLWTLFKEAKGDNFGSYGMNRYERLKNNIRVYRETFP